MIVIERRQANTGTTSFSSTSTSSSSSSSRASSSGSSSQSLSFITTSSPTPSLVNNPLFHDPTGSSVPTPTPLPDDVQMQTVKTVLEWLFLAFALLLLVVLAIRRANKLRNRGIPISQFFVRRSYRRRHSQGLLSNPNHPETTQIRRLPRTTGLPTLSPSTASAPYHLAEIPVAHLGDRQGSSDRYLSHINQLLYGHGRRARTRGADIDEGGRRGIGERDVERDYFNNDHVDGDGALPAYDKHGSPPVYVEVLGTRAANTGSSRERSATEEGTRESTSVPVPSYASSMAQSAPDGNRNATLTSSSTEASIQNTPSTRNPFLEQGADTIRPPTRSRPPQYSSSFSMMPGSLSNW
ncbi:hypothetical protein L218DRAFT_963984 [Marasmius fiardii PR-910]|nr:hypothetical protein L218DRAFT_963984 [Marasmius fiardii PR-910]